jgi:hypothetical protein
MVHVANAFEHAREEVGAESGLHLDNEYLARLAVADKVATWHKHAQEMVPQEC